MQLSDVSVATQSAGMHCQGTLSAPLACLQCPAGRSAGRTLQRQPASSRDGRSMSPVRGRAMRPHLEAAGQRPTAGARRHDVWRREALREARGLGLCVLRHRTFRPARRSDGVSYISGGRTYCVNLSDRSGIRCRQTTIRTHASEPSQLHPAAPGVRRSRTQMNAAMAHRPLPNVVDRAALLSSRCGQGLQTACR